MPDRTLLHITRLGAQGDGVADAGGEIRHIPGALPGETFEHTAAGDYRLLGSPSDTRRKDLLCPHVPRCGGCSVQHMDEALYRQWKSGLLAEALAQRGLLPPVSEMESVSLGSRRRATFSAEWIDGEPRLGFHGRQSHDLEPMTACAVLRPAIVRALPHLSRLAATVVRKPKPFRLSVLAADNGLDVVIDCEASPEAKQNTTALARLFRDAGAVRLTCGSDLVLQAAEPSVTIAEVSVTPPPGTFLQAATETDALLAHHVTAGIGKAKRVLDLFCGLDTLSLALARKAHITAVDSDTSLLSALRKASNGAQGLKPIEPLRRDLFRDPLSPKELEKTDAVVLDPPRAGAAAQCQSIARSKVRRVVMVSCNPATLARDLRTLVDAGYVIESVVPIDQFLYTHHLEAVAVLTRK
jgi:23S rRNA (uracil1939-C5)-methyltransferase